jgi:hypothetical protein
MLAQSASAILSPSVTCAIGVLPFGLVVQREYLDLVQGGS